MHLVPFMMEDIQFFINPCHLIASYATLSELLQATLMTLTFNY